MKINSNEYWDTRFEKDWTEYGGEDQSRYFARVLIEALPEWLKKDMRENNYSICDWGCAQGDGTDIFSTIFNKKVVGVDFSGIAVEQAKIKYTSSEFININILDEANRPEVKFDIVISSNTLEHFYEPFKILNTLKNISNGLLIISVPYEEINRIEEHHFTFLSDNIPLSLGDSWNLLIHREVDCRNHQPSFWPGKQIVLVYCSKEWIDAKNLTISDIITSSSFDALYYSEELFNHKVKLKQLSMEYEKLTVQLESCTKQLDICTKEYELLKIVNSESLFRKLARRIFRK